MDYAIVPLPLAEQLETPTVLKKAIAANKALAELKGVAQTIPNQGILISALAIQESKDSSAIESIVTTHDELFRYEDKPGFSAAAKEVHRYRDALFHGFKCVQNGVISNNNIIEIVKIVTARDIGYRNTPGTTLKNGLGEVIYTPPQSLTAIIDHMNNLEQFINNSELSDLDPLVKMAVIHHQFESIHPFFDGNGRTGRILNILYLLLEGVLDIPVLYLSRYIISHKNQYYQLLQKVRNEGTWEEWIIFMLKATESTAQQSIKTVEGIKELMAYYKTILRAKTPKFYSHELINTIFNHPYTKIEHVVKATKVSRITASKHLTKLVELGLLKKTKYKNTNYYVNKGLFRLFMKM